MSISNKDQIVSVLPVDRLSIGRIEVEAKRDRYLSPDELKEMLRKFPVEFMVANVGSPLKRIEVERCYEYWKSEVQPHLVADAQKGFRLEDFPNSYAYIASEWSGQIETPIVLLELYH
jgi:hypothetical protein